MWWTVLGTATAAVSAALLVANSSWILPKQSSYDLALLEKSWLKRLADARGEMVRGEDLWKKTGAVIMVEAAQLSSLLPELTRGVPIYGIVLESKGANSFNDYLKGEMFLDEEKVFYGPTLTKMGLLGLIRLNTYLKYWTAYSSGVDGNTKGEGTILGSTLVIGSGEQGILYEHRAREFGDTVNIRDVLEAVKKIR